MEIEQQSWGANPYEFDQDDQRFERKFVTDAMSAPDLDTLLRAHPASFKIAYPDRWINNFYFDTESLTCYYDHIGGCRSRAKFRIRWYGDMLQEKARPVLEIKRKIGMVGSKLRFELPEFDSTENLSDEGLKELVRSANIDPRIQSWVDSMRCMVANRYERTYFVTTDNHFRMTIDRNIQFTHVPTWSGVQLDQPIEDTTVVLELKYHNELDGQVEKVTKHLPLRINRMSKYIRGLEQLNAHGRW